MEGDGSFAYIIFPPYWRNGYGREMSERLLTHAFEVYGPPNMFAEIDTRNTESIRLVEAMGLVRTRHTRDAAQLRGEASHEYTYSISRDAWQSRGASTRVDPVPAPKDSGSE